MSTKTLKSIKTGISFPKADYEEIEAYRKRHHQSRSEVLLTAFRAFLQMQTTADLDAQYQMGYLKHPEKPKEIEAFTKAGLSSWQEK